MPEKFEPYPIEQHAAEIEKLYQEAKGKGEEITKLIGFVANRAEELGPAEGKELMNLLIQNLEVAQRKLKIDLGQNTEDIVRIISKKE